MRKCLAVGYVCFELLRRTHILPFLDTLHGARALICSFHLLSATDQLGRGKIHQFTDGRSRNVLPSLKPVGLSGVRPSVPSLPVEAKSKLVR